MKHSIAQLLGLATVLSAVSCTVDDRYSLDKMQNLDASVTPSSGYFITAAVYISCSFLSVWRRRVSRC